MKAIVMNDFGNPEILKEQAVSSPQIHDDQVLVEMYATSINPVDTNIRGGRVKEAFPVHQFPHILGLDVAGVVTEVGAKVSHLKPGDRVYGLGSSGSYAEYAVAEQSMLAKLSPDIPFHIAGALPAVALTAWHSLFVYGSLQPGERCLIHAGAGGVGHVAIQMAKHAGAYVITTASARNHDLVKELGADEAIDYQTDDFSELIHEVDLVLDAVIGADQEKNFKVLRNGGRVVSIVTPNISELAQACQVNAKFVVVQPTRDELEEIERWVREQKLHVHIDHIFPLTETALIEAHRKIETKHARGKLVVRIKNEE
ncbi:NADP-dependent oxidoreductase [Xylanibacillus composti]|uniref:NADPH:quinone reductase n=1 Tax=Xylanibacillus composti TaxID=1572762 RepID=A0A8J4M1W8_9BACL|nr:NADP-dependent oxidoreductase [Xylanibacillus composti]MDT9724830.1 NADP-dependent oxidoreductase [Xylanibacillus composti]GIQ69079.1 NADPH:quinone reductase [Xylanibacillus composti]